jgi:hypothetical protein
MGLRSASASFRDLAVVQRRQRLNPEAGNIMGGSVIGDMIAITSLDLIACTILIVLAVALEPRDVATVLTGRIDWLGWFLLGLAAPFVASRAFVGRAVARLVDNIYELPPNDGEQWISDPWRVRDKVRRTLLDRVFPVADRRVQNAEADYRGIERSLRSGEVLPITFYGSVARYFSQKRVQIPATVRHLLIDVGTFQDLSEPEQISACCRLLHGLIMNGMTAPLMSFCLDQ